MRHFKHSFTLLLSLGFTSCIFAQNVGIGTATPANKLHVVGGDNTSTVGGATTNKLLIVENSVGGAAAMGTKTTSAGNLFETRWGINPTFAGLGGVGVSELQSNYNGNSISLLTYDYVNRSLVLGLNAGTSPVINVGIGTGIPVTRLDVAGLNNWNTATSEGDVRIGDVNYRLKIGVALGGGGAGDIRLTAAGGTNRLFFGGGTNTAIAVVDGNNQRVGINTFDPNTTLDVWGDLALKTTAATLVGVSPNFSVNTLTTPRSYYRVSTPTNNFNITDLTVAAALGTSSSDGRIVTLYNATAFTMTINNQDISVVAANRIITGTGGNLNIPAGGSITFVYNTTDNRWVVKDYNIGDGQWKLDGNNNAALRTIGTNDAFDFPMETSGTEKARLTTGGIFAVGNTAFGMNPNITGFDKIGAFSDGFGYITTHSVENASWSDYFVNTKSRGTGAAPAIVANGDFVGGLWGNAYDGTNYQWMTSIVSNVDGTPGAGDMPGRLTFGTSPDGSNYPVERMRITNAGNVGINTSTPTSKLHVNNVADVAKTTTFSYASQNATNTDYDNIAIMGLGKGGNSSWGYSAGVMGIGDQANSWYAQGVYAGLGTGTAALPSVDAALYVDANDLGLAAHFREGSVVVDGADQNTGAINYGVVFGATSGEGIGSKRTAAGNQYGLDFYQGFVNRMRIWNDGRVGIGQSNLASLQPTHKLWVKDPSATDTDINIFSARNSAAAGSTWEMGSVEYYTEGYDNIGFSSWVSPLGSNGAASLGSNFGSNYDGWRWGTLYANNGTINTSDTTLKKNIRPISYGLDQIRQIDPITYVWKEDRKFKDFVVPDEDKQYHLGFNAQQLKLVLPEVVESWGWLHDKEQDYKKVKYESMGVNYAEITPVVVNAVKELDKQQQNMMQNMTASDFGVSEMTSNQVYVPFSPNFKTNLMQTPAVTVTALQQGVSLYISEIDANGFMVNVNGSASLPVSFNWIAMGKINAANMAAKLSYSAEEHAEKLKARAEMEAKMISYKEIRLQREKEAKSSHKTTEEAGSQSYQSLQNQYYPPKENKKSKEATTQKSKNTEATTNSLEGAMHPTKGE